MSVSKSRFTVAKLDAGMAILLTSDHHLIEFPSLLLPSGVAAGSIIDLSVAQNSGKEKEEHDKFVALQKEIHDLFAIHPPSTPELHVRNTTQTSVVLEWDLLDLATADMKSLSLYKNGSKLGKIPNATTTTTKLSGLALDTEYTFQLVLRTTAGIFKSKELKVKTHKMTNLTGLNVCLSHLPDQNVEKITQIMARIGANPPHTKVKIDTTHFITNRGAGDEFKKAQNLNIPIVVPEFVEACEAEGRLMRVGSYYLDSDPALRSKVVAPRTSQSTTSVPANAAASTTTEVPSSATTAADVESMLPKRTTPLTEDPETTGTAGQSGEPGPLSTAGVTSAIVATAQQVQSIAAEGLDKVSNMLQGDQNEGESNTGEAISAAEAAPTVTAEATTRKDEIEPNERATQSVVDLPSQVEDAPSERHSDAFPPSMGRSIVEDMEDVAL